MSLRVYISGPISSGGRRTDPEAIDAYCKVAAAEAQRLITWGYSILWPHGTVWMERLTGVRNDHDRWVENDIPWVLQAEAVLRIAGDSAGADAECEAARKAGIPVFDSVEELLEGIDDSPALKAHALVNGARQKNYGHPIDDFSRTAQMWSALFGVEVTAEHVALAMACVKISRLVQTPDHYDSIVDLAGYGETLHKVVKERKCRGSLASPPSRLLGTDGRS